jgi:hypothetical protein
MAFIIAVGGFAFGIPWFVCGAYLFAAVQITSNDVWFVGIAFLMVVFGFLRRLWKGSQ